jgi:pyruvate, water dikinase
MNPSDRPIEDILRDLQERAKELECLYQIEELLVDSASPLEEIFAKLARVIPMGWQMPGICRARIVYRGESYAEPGYEPTPWEQTAPIRLQEETVGQVEVCYTQAAPRADEGPFLKEERRLVNSIAERIGLFLVHRDLREAMTALETSRRSVARTEEAPWLIILDFLKRTDQVLLLRIARKMANHLAWNGVDDALRLLQGTFPSSLPERGPTGEENQPLERTRLPDSLRIAEKTFGIAALHLTEDEIVHLIQTWIKEDKSRFLVNTIESRDSSLLEVRDALEKYRAMGPEMIELTPAAEKGVLVSLLHAFCTDQVEFINTAKRFVRIGDFFPVIDHTVFPPKSHGKLGGKSAGLFLAMAVLREVRERNPALGRIKSPRTWYITSDGVLDFIRHNSLEDVYNQKYVDIDQVRQEYPHIVQLFKNSRFTGDLLDGLSVLLDDLEGRPIIVRSSSLLEDRYGAAFSGKYKSLFLANTGTKQERLAALTDAIAEIYASTFGPDPIEYRAERGLIDVYEEMGVMIQEVVGSRVGPYFLPSFAGVAFSRNEFRWSSRIKREDGLVRMVPGLGTRAVDRLRDDYPMLLAPGQPGLRVNVTPDEVLRYSPKKVDAVNLESGNFETIDIPELLRKHGEEYPLIRSLVSIWERGMLREPVGFGPDFETDDLVVTFDGLFRRGDLVATMRSLLKVLEEAMGTPVDVEFAHDGTDLYLVQCRPQSNAGDSAPASIPREIPEDSVVFSANRYVSNGRVPGITHIVYVDPARYNDLENLEEMRQVGRAVGRLNNLLPRRRFILMGPGRWGSRGDIRLGVNVTYSDINNTAVLVEIARKKGSYVPDLSFGTHFFQDLVESSIRYLPLYPDDAGIRFDEVFLGRSPSILPSLLPEYAHLGEVLRVIDVPAVSGGRVLRVLMNADLDEALGYLGSPRADAGDTVGTAAHGEDTPEQHWRWRLHFAERIAAELDPDRFGVVAFYVMGSTKNATAGPGSDIDLILHVRSSESQRQDLAGWLEGWSRCLSEVNYLRTGYRTTGGLLDVHFITDDDIERKTSFAVKIGAISDPAREIPLNRRVG